jgi:hypothetical protein
MTVQIRCFHNPLLASQMILYKIIIKGTALLFNSVKCYFIVHKALLKALEDEFMRFLYSQQQTP